MGVERGSGRLGVLACCVFAVCAGCVHPASRGVDALEQTLRSGTEEERYGAARALATRPGSRSRALLREQLKSPDAMTRNAAARSLCDLGDPEASEVLIANLDRAARTFVATDAIYHLRKLFGTDRGYDPNLGYLHQTVTQQDWWDWFAAQDFGSMHAAAEAPDPERERMRAEAQEHVRGFEEARFERDRAQYERILQLWKELAPLAASRDPEDLRVVERGFELFAARWEENVDLWNNHALAALQLGLWERAEHSYRRALALRPESTGLHNDYGILLEGLGRLEDAEEQYRTAARLDPKDDIARTNLADVLRKQGRTQEAVAAYREAEILAPDKWPYHRLWIGRLNTSP